MSDGGVKQAISEVGAALIKPVTDEVGKAIEQGAQSIVGSPQLDPGLQQQKKLAESKRRQEVLRRLDWFKKLAADQQKVGQAKKQQGQILAQEEQRKKQILQFESTNKLGKQQAAAIAIKNAQTRTETKKGVGG